MAFVLVFCGSAIIIAVILYNHVIFPAFISSLSKVPTAHPLCSVTSRWFSRQRQNQREVKTLYAAHQKHGPIVRLGPNEVSVVSREGLRQIYTAGLEKTSFYSDFQTFGVPNLFSMVDHKSHSIQKRMITNLYANSHIQHSEDVDELSRKIVLDRLLPMLQRFARNKGDVDVFKLFQWIGVDFVTAFSFGSGRYTDFLADERTRDLYFAEWNRVRDGDDFSRKNVMEGVAMKMCKGVLSNEPQDEASSGTRPIVFAKLHSQMTEVAKREELELSQENILRQCASEILDHMIAGSETTGITLTYAAYHLSLDPGLQTALRLELLTLEPVVGVSTGKILPPPAAIDQLPLLDAVVKETLRLYAANPTRLPRRVPTRGIRLHGFDIPAGTTVSCNAYCLHRNEAVFPQPFQFLPYRWISTEAASDAKNTPSIEEMKRWLWAFGSGGRMCIGSNLALQTIKLVLAAIYTTFETLVVNDEGIEQKDAVIATPVGNKLIFQFRAVDGISD